MSTSAASPAAGPESRDGKIAIAPLIDVGFLLVIYFLITSTLLPREGDLAMALGGIPRGAMHPDPAEVVISARGEISLAGSSLTLSADDLVGQLERHRVLAEATNREPLVVIDAHDEVPHQRFVDVLGAVKRAEIEGISLRR